MNCKDCQHVKEDKWSPGTAIGRCMLLSSRYGADMAWSEVGNQFVSVWVGENFGCIHFQEKQ